MKFIRASFGVYSYLVLSGVVWSDQTIGGKLTVDQDGSATALEVNGGASGSNIAVFRRDVGADAEIRFTASGGYPEIIFDDKQSGSGHGLWAMGLASGDNKFRIMQDPHIDGGVNYRFTIEKEGNIGIGTSDPSSLLHMRSLGSQSLLNIENSGSGNYSGINFIRERASGLGVTGGSIFMKSDASTNAGYLYLQAQTANANAGVTGALGVGNGVRLVLRGGNGAATFDYGNVGIGTTTPAYKLDVKGTIRAEEVIVETGWSDYVFEEGYRLRPLSEIEAHIGEFGHLPGVPSAAEVAGKGVSVGDSQRLMLEKIEELTLYAIEQEKELKEKNEKIRSLEHRLERLESVVSRLNI